jgi:hypothetical protein
MSSIPHNLVQFSLDLRNNIPIICDEKRKTWYRPSTAASLVGYLVDNEDNRLLAIGKTFCELLNELEQTAVCFPSDPKQNYSSYLIAAKCVKHALSYSTSPKVKKQLDDLAYRVTALKYRIESPNKGLEPEKEYDDLLYEKLIPFAAESKRKSPISVEKTLVEKDKVKIKEACRYPKFARQLLKSRALSENFFKSIMRDNTEVCLFIQYPALFERLKTSYLIPRIGRFSQPMLRLEKKTTQNGFEKVVTLPFLSVDGVKRINILNESAEITLQHGWKLTVKKICQIFSEKNENPGDLEFFGSVGIANWNSRELGTFKANEFNKRAAPNGMIDLIKKVFLNFPKNKEYELIDLEKEEWWKQLPVFEEFSKEELEKRNQIVLNSGEWLVCANSARSSINLDLDDRHGYMELFIPQPNEKYHLFPLGKFAENFALTWAEKLSMLVNTVKAKIAYPDENEYYTQRQHASYPIILSRAKGLELMGLIRSDLIKAREGNIVFQFGAENCAHWVQSTLELIKDIKIQNLFIYPLLQCNPVNGLIKRLFTIIRKAPENWQNKLLNVIDKILGSWRGLQIKENGKLVWKSHDTNPFRKDQVIFQPGYLNKQIEEKKLKGRIYTVHQKNYVEIK